MLEGCKLNKCLEKRKRKAGWDGVVRVLGKGKVGDAYCSMKWCDLSLSHSGILKFYNDVSW